MTINRENYESYFILYIDRELNADDRKAVEEFLQLNPDLQPEFDQFAQAVLLVDEDIQLSNKESLLKTPTTLTQQEEELLLLSVDEELSPVQQLELNKLLKEESLAKQEWDYFQQTKLEADLSVVHPNKASLYREENKKRPVIFMNWQRLAVAAMIAIVLGLTWVYTSNENNHEADGHSLANTNNTTNGENGQKQVINPFGKTSNDISAQTNDQVTDHSGTHEDPSQQIQTTEVKTNSQYVANRDNRSSSSITTPTTAVRKDNVVPVQDNIIIVNGNNLPKPRDIDNRDELVKQIAANQDSKKDNINSNHAVTESSITPSYTALTTSTVTDTDNGKKNKHRGFFRKLTRVVEKGTNVDIANGDEVSILGFAIKM